MKIGKHEKFIASFQDKKECYTYKKFKAIIE